MSTDSTTKKAATKEDIIDLSMSEDEPPHKKPKIKPQPSCEYTGNSVTVNVSGKPIAWKRPTIGKHQRVFKNPLSYKMTKFGETVKTLLISNSVKSSQLPIFKDAIKIQLVFRTCYAPFFQLHDHRGTEIYFPVGIYRLGPVPPSVVESPLDMDLIVLPVDILPFKP